MKVVLKALGILGVTLLLLMLILLVLIVGKSRAADLTTRQDLRHVLWDWIDVDSTDAHWTAALLEEQINNAQRLIETFSGTNEHIADLVVSAGVAAYDMPDGCSKHTLTAIVNVDDKGNWIPLNKRSILEFGTGTSSADGWPTLSIYALQGDTILIDRVPDDPDTLKVFFYTISSDMAADSTPLDVEAVYRLPVLMMAYGMCCIVRNDQENWWKFYQAAIEMVYNMPVKPQEKLQEFGTQTEGGGQ